jgi:hypothetical protein
MAEVMFVVTTAATNFGGFFVHQRNHRVIGDPLALYAEVVDVVTQT